MLAIAGGSELSHVCLVGAHGRRELQRYSPHQYGAGGVDDMILLWEGEKGGEDGRREGPEGGERGDGGFIITEEQERVQPHVYNSVSMLLPLLPYMALN